MMIFIIVLIAIILIIGFARTTYLDKGEIGERAVGSELKWANKIGAEGLMLFNVYVPMNNGKTTEIDLLYITKVGIFVLESKNYKGWIFGTDTNKNWTEVLYTRKTWTNPRGSEKHSFYNPIMQNNTHINWLRRYLNTSVPMFSLSVFSSDCEFKAIDLSHSPNNVFVCYRRDVSEIIKQCHDDYPTVLSESQIERIYDKLLPLTNVDKAKKEQHKQDVWDRKHGLVCPRCGGRLVLRTANRGNNAGSQFYGCSNYPKCKFTRNIDN